MEMIACLILCSVVLFQRRHVNRIRRENQIIRITHARVMSHVEELRKAA